MDDLLRELAPISKDAWSAIDEEAKQHLTVSLAGRRIVDFIGPLGWPFSAVDLGQAKAMDAQPEPGVSAALRRVLPLVELRAPFELSRRETRYALPPARSPSRRTAPSFTATQRRASWVCSMPPPRMR